MTIDLNSLTVVIPTWNTADLTIRCVAALEADGVARERIVLVDNGSTDDTYERLSRELPGCRLIRFEENIGYGGAMNAGAKELPGEAYLLPNNDAFVHDPGSVTVLLRTLDDPTVGLSFPRYLNEDLTLQPSVMPTHSPLTALIRASGLSRFVPNRWAAKLTTHWDHSTARDIDGANGAVMLFRGETWRPARRVRRAHLHLRRGDRHLLARAQAGVADLVHARGPVRAPRQQLGRQGVVEPDARAAHRRVGVDGHPLAPAARVGRRHDRPHLGGARGPPRRLQAAAATARPSRPTVRPCAAF